MFYIVGLGNPGIKYRQTRHNIGFLVCDAFVAALELPEATLIKKIEGRVSEGLVQGEPVTVLYPETFMNNSGRSVSRLMPKGAHDQLILVYDDVDLALGEMKISYGSGAGGHNGVSSVISELGTKDFVRVRIGISKRSDESESLIRPSGEELASYVLGKLSATEREVINHLLPKVIESILVIILEGKERAMNLFN